MSTIVAVRKGNYAAIACDSLTGQGSVVVPGSMLRHSQKIHFIAGAYVGIVGSIGHHNVFGSLSKSNPGLFNFDGSDEVFETLRKIYPLLRDEYYLLSKVEHEDQEYESSQMAGLIISTGGIFSFSSYREVAEYDAFWASGSGRDVALGALEVAYASELGAKSVAETAVRAACKFDSYSDLPLVSYQLELDPNSA
jgi:ATP-dependent HslUV protease, peptidase subunit HslV